MHNAHCHIQHPTHGYPEIYHLQMYRHYTHSNEHAYGTCITLSATPSIQDMDIQKLTTCNRAVITFIIAIMEHISPRLGKRELILVLFVRLFDLRLF